LGSLYLAEDFCANELKEEFETLLTLGAKDIEWWDKEKV